MKRFLTLTICIALLALTYVYNNKVTNKLANLFKSTPTVVAEKKNQYSKGVNYEYLQITDNFVPYNYQELLNVFYTMLDAGYDTFTFYCPEEYTDCLNDVEYISDKNKEQLTTIGNFVSPYNNFSSMEFKFDTAGEVTIKINHLYSKDDIVTVSNKVDSIYKEIIKEGMNDLDIIYAFHDYIINNTKYDSEYVVDSDNNEHDSARAFGPLFEGYAICSGYTDAMGILLDKLGIKNYKVSSATHVWNVFYYDNKWWHIDLTWDDPITKDGAPRLEHTFFKIDTETLERFNIDNHNFDKSIYLELK